MNENENYKKLTKNFIANYAGVKNMVKKIKFSDKACYCFTGKWNYIF